MISRSWQAALAIAAAVTVAGCAGVPDSGPVRVGRSVAAAGDGLADPTVREVPAGPQPGASPVQLVGGFLRAMVDSDGGYGVGRSYLAPGTTWSSGSGITVYAEPSRVVRTGRGTVVVRARRVGEVGPHGVYRVAAGTIRREFGVVKRAGEWRIARLDAGVLLSSDDAGRLLQPAALFFLTPDGSRLVPQPVLEAPQEPGIATTLMRGLLAGPGPFLAPGVRTAVPKGTTLVGNVPISAAGVAEVDLSGGARQINSVQLRRLSAQVVWTLNQLSSVTAVRLLANGAPLEAPGVPSLQPAHSWREFDPAAPSPMSGALVVRNGAVAGLGTGVPFALRGRGFVAVARSHDGSVVAAVRAAAGHQELLIGKAAGRLHRQLRDIAITSPTFGADDSVVVATAAGHVFEVRAGMQPKRVRLAGRLKLGSIRGLAVSHDGSRVAVLVTTTAGTELDVATVVLTDSTVSFRKPRVVLPATADVSGVAWAEADEIVATVARDGGPRGVVRVSADGYRLEDLSGEGLPPDVDSVAAAPQQRVLAAAPGGTWQLVGRRWRQVSAGVSPGYAGG